FAKGINDREIYQNVREGKVWSGWTTVPGDLRTQLAVAAAFNGPLMLVAARHVLAHRPIAALHGGKLPGPQPVDGSIHYNMFGNEFGPRWNGWREIPGKTTHIGVATTALGPAYQVFAVGPDEKIYGNVG